MITETDEIRRMIRWPPADTRGTKRTGFGSSAASVLRLARSEPGSVLRLGSSARTEVGEVRKETEAVAGKRVDLFATARELSPIIAPLMRDEGVKLVRAGAQDSPTPTFLTSLEQLPDQGTVLIVPAGVSVDSRSVPQDRGGVLFFFDQAVNPRTVVLRPSWLCGQDKMITGLLATASDDPRSLALCADIARRIRRVFTKVKSFWLGPQALRLLDGGGRLAQTPKSPTMNDLQR